jgi:DNA-binding transcriptional LysR family regulator
MYSYHLRVFHAAVMAGVGIGMVSRLAVMSEAQDGRLRIVSVRDFQVERQFSIIRRNDVRLPAPAEAFLRLLCRPGYLCH